MMGIVRSLHDYTNGPIQGKCCRCAIGTRPGSVKAGFGTHRSTCGNGAIVRDIGNGHCTTTLGVAAIPDLRDALSVGERELQVPAIDGRRTRIGNS